MGTTTTETPVLLADGAALTAVGTLFAAGLFIVLGVVVLAIQGGIRARGAERRRIAAIEPMPDLLRRLDGALLQADEAVRAADQERMFADAEFGSERAEALAGAVRSAQGALDAAFARRRAVQDLQDAGREGEARSAASGIEQDLREPLESLRSRTAEIANLRDDARHAPQRRERAGARLAELEALVEPAREALAGVIAGSGAAAAASIPGGPGAVDRATRLLASARTHLQVDGTGAAPSAATGTDVIVPRAESEELAGLSSAEHELQDADSLLRAARGLPEALTEARAQLTSQSQELETSLARARATRDADPRLPQAIAVAEQALRAAGDPTAPDPVSLLARMRSARGELDAAIDAARERFDAAQRRAQEDHERNRLLSDAYDPGIGDAAAASGMRRYGPIGGYGPFGDGTFGGAGTIDPARPGGIAGGLGAEGSPARSGTDLLGLALGELTHNGYRAAGRRPRRSGRF